MTLQANNDPWTVTEDALDLTRLDWSESIFALSNGHLGLRGNLEEGEPFGELGTYLNGVHELRPLPYAEAGYGDPESGQTVINVTNGKLIRLLVDDEPFDVRYGEVRSHTRVLDLRAGTLRREVEWVSPAGQEIRLRTTRLVSLTQRAVAAIEYEVEAIGQPARIVLQSELVVNEAAHGPRATDPRAAAVLSSPLVAEEHVDVDNSVVLVHRAALSGIRVAASMDHVVDPFPGAETKCESLDDLGRFTITARLPAGQRLRIVKFLGYGWSAARSAHALRDQAAAAVHAARFTGWDGLLGEQRHFLDEFWDSSNVEIPGDLELERAVRFGMFHTLQAGARAEGQAIPAKGLTGTGYDGHAFWDSEAFVLPFLTSAYPNATREALRWRHSTLPIARDRATTLGLRGAAFPWRTINGAECSGYWPAGTAAFHVNAAVADAAIQYIDATNDNEFASTIGAALVIEAARLFLSLGHHEPDGTFHIDGVTGPDEYSAIADDNVYTNLMARRTFNAAIAITTRHPGCQALLEIRDGEAAEWNDAAERMSVPFDIRYGIHPQAKNFTNHAVWNFAATRPDQYPLLQAFPYFDIYRKQVVKQADLVLAMHRCPDEFSDEQKRANFAYYERITVRDSSLSAASQGVVAAELGHLDLAGSYLNECAFIDLLDLNHNTADGIHLAANAGAWSVVVAGYGGMRIADGTLRFAPRIGGTVDALSFTLRYRERAISVAIRPDEVDYRIVRGEPLTILHYGQQLLIDSAGLTTSIPLLAAPPAVHQPFGREPFSRTAGIRDDHPVR